MITKRLEEVSNNALELAWAYPTSLYGGFKKRRLFESVETYSMFLGAPRSGHSLVGALLDAHPDMVVAHELDVLKYVYARFRRNQIYDLLLGQSHSFTARGHRIVTYTYTVPNQWQGRFEKLRIIGDKHGESTTLRLQADPWLLDRLRDVIPEPIKIIQVVRNPYDSIGSMSVRRGLSLRESTEYYFSLCETIADVRTRINSSDLFEIRHESFITDTEATLQALCAFLGATATDAYCADCASIVFKTPKKTRSEVHWDPELIDEIEERLQPFSFLQGYAYAD